MRERTKEENYQIQIGIIQMIDDEFIRNQKFYTKKFTSLGISQQNHSAVRGTIARFLHVILYYIDTGTDFLDDNIYEGAKIFYDNMKKKNKEK